ncbi:hypothetical protein AB0C74_10625 [Spirillospora sp. NPDC048832]
MSWDDERVREHVQRLEGLLEGLDPAAADAVQALVELYGEALDRVMRLSGDAAALVEDELIRHLLLVHGLHPEPAEERVRRALGGLAEFLAKHRTTAELGRIEDGTLHLAVAAEGRAAPPRPVLEAVERAVRAAAPELDRVDIAAPAREPVLITLDRVRSRT